jgi:hypothetical protein
VPIAMQAATDRTISICRLMDLMGDSFVQCEGMIARDEKGFMTGEKRVDSLCPACAPSRRSGGGRAPLTLADAWLHQFSAMRIDLQ